MNRKRILDTMLELCAIPSISETQGEVETPVKIMNIIQRLNYFKHYPHHLQIHPIPNDPLSRSYITAFMKGKIESKKTVILLSHYDVVGIEEFGIAKKYAFDPLRYTEYLKTTKVMELPYDALKDLNSDDYLFGRGVMDMKYGIAANIEVLCEMEKSLNTFEGNLLLLSVPDEEANSVGMLAAVETLLSLKREKSLDYQCALICEPHFPKHPGDNSIYIYNGTVGKLLPVFYCVGKAAHVGEPFAGINPNLFTAKLIEKIDQNPYLCDSIEGISTPPPTCLKQSDTKKNYSVQTPAAAFCYFNFITLSSTPEKILLQLKELASKVFQEVLDDIKEKAILFHNLTGNQSQIQNIQPKVVSYDELYQLCLKAHGPKFSKHIETYKASISNKDLREASIDLVREIHEFSPYRDPMIVIFFAPPYYPHSNAKKTSKVLEVCEHILDIANDDFHEPLKLEPFFPGLSDMSYLGISDEIAIEPLKKNLPLWGNNYFLPFNTIAELNIPFINIGPLGKDPHKYTERICLSYSLDRAPHLIYQAILKAFE